MSELTELLRGIIREEMAWSGAPGVTMAIVHDGQTEYICEGYKDLDTKEPVDEDTLFVIASCSKSMTTAMLGRLVDQGILSWDEPVTTYAPELILMDEASRGMTLRDMCYHRTGLANHDGMWPDVTGRDVLAQRVRYLEPNLQFIEKRQYNNVIYALTAYVAECATGKTYAELMKEYIFDPLEMHSTFATYEGYTTYGNLAEPYYYSKAENKLVKQDKWNMDSAVAAASIATNAVDMAKWLKFNISGGLDAKGNRLLSEDSWDQIHNGGVDASEDLRKDHLTFDKYAFAWWNGSYRGHKIYKHTGKINGYSSLEIMIPELGMGCFSSINIHCPEAHLYYRTSYTCFDYLMGACKDGSEWKNVYRKEGDTPLNGWKCNDLNYMPEIKGQPAPMKLPLSAYAGTYFDKGYGPLRIANEGGQLVAYHRNYVNPLTHYDGDTFQALEFWEDVLNITMPFKFVIRPGEFLPAEVVLPMESMVKPVHFTRIK